MIGRREFMALLGGAAAWPLPLNAQQAAKPVIGFLHPQTAGAAAQVVAAFLAGLESAGFVEGRNVAIEFRWAEGRNDRLFALASDLVQRHVAVIAAPGGDSSASAIKAATTAIPVVSTFASDPVRNGFVVSLMRPGGNFTGVYRFGSELEPKRLEILCEVMPKVTMVDMLVNPEGAITAASSRDVKAAARLLGRQIRSHNARNESEIHAAFATLSQLHAGALLIMGDSYFTGHSRQIGVLANSHGIPAIYATREFTSAGGLMSYAAEDSGSYRLVGNYTGRILKGEKPADLPVQQSTKVELIINLKTAKALGIEVPPTLLARADEVIE
jgi:putative tryptophan/tyrosine transport system substrate-binding protein